MQITREVVEGVGPGDIDVRLYTDGRVELPSVTTVLKTRDDDKSNLYDWQDRNDGVGDSAHHEHLFWYSRQVGTLGHWFALRELDPTLEWTEDEGQSAWALGNVGTLQDADEQYEAEDPRTGRVFKERGSNHEEVIDSSPEEVLYSVLRGDKNKGGGTVSTWGEFYDRHPPGMGVDYYENELVTRALRDIEFFVDAQKRLWSKLGVDTDSVIEVEKFLFNEYYGYAGQVDLVYEDPDGNIVVADLKSSSGCYDKHQIQGSAYGKAIELAEDVPVDGVDRLEVHRAHPRTGQMAVHTHRNAPNKAPIHTTKYWNEGYDDLWARFETLVDRFTYET